MILTRIDKLASGIFGNLCSLDGEFLVQTLEHSYPNAWGTAFLPKIPAGVYTCVRGLHQLKATPLHPNPKPFATFEITNVPGHTDILFHSGNFNGDTEGCVLLGLKRLGSFEILESKLAFEAFMKNREGIQTFQLEVDQPL